MPVGSARCSARGECREEQPSHVDTLLSKRRPAAQSASTPAIAFSPTSMACQTRPAWNGSPAAKRSGTVVPSVFFPSQFVERVSDGQAGVSGLVPRLGWLYQLAYSGDSEWTDTLIEIGRRADLFVCECYTYDRPVKSHTDFATLAEHLGKIAPRRLILTHMSDDMLAHVGDVPHPTAADGMVVEF